MPDRRACSRSKWAKIPQISGMACHSAEFLHGLDPKQQFGKQFSMTGVDPKRSFTIAASLALPDQLGH